MKRSSLLRALGVTIVFGALAIPGAASAYSYDNTDPVQTGCNNSAWNAKSAGIYDPYGNWIGATYLRFSNGCGTAWGRMVSNWNATLYCSVHRTNDGYAIGQFWSGTACYSNQVYDYGSLHSYAWGGIQSPGSGNYYYSQTASY